jgi:hypothetical protein
LDFFHSRFGSGRGGDTSGDVPAADLVASSRPSSSRRRLSWSWTEMASSSKCTVSSRAFARGLLRWLSTAAHSDLRFTQRRQRALVAISGPRSAGNGYSCVG